MRSSAAPRRPKVEYGGLTRSVEGFEGFLLVRSR